MDLEVLEPTSRESWAVAFDAAVRRIPARSWLGLTATPYRRDRLGELIGWQLGPTRHTIHPPRPGILLAATATATATAAAPPSPVLHLRRTGYRHDDDADPSAPGGMAAIYRDLVADDQRRALVIVYVLGGHGSPWHEH